MSPMLSIAMALSEGARYQSAVEMMKETIDASAFSTIGDYDSYLDERFGLMEISQDFLNVDYDNVNGIKGWNAYQTASEIGFALDNIEPNSEIKLIKDVVKTKDPDIYLRIKDNDTKRINIYWLDDFSWEVHDEEEIVLIAQRINTDDTTGNEPVYEMKLLVPQWIEDEYIVDRNLFA